MRIELRGLLCALVALMALVVGRSAHGQSFGVELRNTLMPASGGMAGTSIARPQDLVSGINANPATLTQFEGTQFLLGGAWAEPTINLEQTGYLSLPGVTPFSAKSETPGAAIPNIGVTQDLSAYGMPATLGLALLGAAGGGTSYRKVPASNGTSTYITILEFAPSVGMRLTDRLSVGGTMFIGDGYMDGPFVGDGAMTDAYGLRGSLGMNFDLTENTQIGCYYESRQRFNFKDAVRLQLFDGSFDVSRNVRLELPTNIGFGIANSSLMCGDLLLATDVSFFDWKGAEMFETIYKSQWVLQLGAQYKINSRYRVRCGYAYAENPIDPNTGDSFDGIPIPGGIPAVKYLQAQFAVVSQHRISAGIGVRDVLPGLDFDALAGGMFNASQQLGPLTSTNIESYWVGIGFTWRFNRGACCVN